MVYFTIGFVKDNLTSSITNCLVDISEECNIPGTMWHSVISFNNQVISRFAVCVDHIYFLFGDLIAIGCWATCLFATGTVSDIKCPYAPKSETVISICLVKHVLLIAILAYFSLYSFFIVCDKIPCLMLGFDMVVTLYTSLFSTSLFFFVNFPYFPF